ncbi:NAD-dependent epimerase/dehydratase family protein [Solihabitans fulvus]|uniref:NAD-dependent epimerase/dehydratase family protein n=1 Tax=Solihabitans fulvus TaxID=1892852 RepID=A0A5B2XHH0_9PSEU|nr:NAD-dependent epimerase/dehydratase family protein [Solihabitans fulvus]KAA2263257.1 NAD-dependent epimerase/dehydratase family protein [Solihabitans fulvus]
MRVLLIGATGFLGGHVLDLLSATEGTTVVTAGRSPVAASAAHLRLDLGGDDVAGIGSVLAEASPDAVVNCAGATGGEPATLAAANATGPARLATAMLRVRPAARLVHLGSSAEYGRVPVGVPVTEDAPECPVGAYGLAKLGGTRAIEVARAAGLAAVTLRVFNPVGPGSAANSLSGRLVAELDRAIAEGDDVRLGPLGAERDFVDARDVARAVLAALEASTVDAPVLNVGSGSAVPSRVLAALFTGVAGFTGRVLEEAAGSARSADVPWQQADLRLVTTALGWRPGTDLAASVRDHWLATR